ncbi:hypothetical protein WA556_004463, partial [Blastocystis sp. ATCC 50177/Nand II]
MLRTVFARADVEAMMDALHYTKPCQETIPSFDSSPPYFAPENGLIPAPLSKQDALFEEKKSTFFAFGFALGLCLQNHLQVDFPPHPLFLQYLTQGVPRLRSTEEVSLLLQQAGEPFSSMFSGLLKIMMQLSRGEAVDVSAMMISCALPSNPSVNLVPEFSNDADAPLSSDAFPLWLSRYIQCVMGEGIRPAFKLINSGLKQVLDPKILSIFTDRELEEMLFSPPAEWTREMLLESIDFSGRFGKEDAYTQQFVDVLVSLTSEERDRLLLFVTGRKRFSKSTSLFSVVESTAGEDSLPTSSTCVRLLHLPRYPSKEILRDKLLKAINLGYNRML